MTINKLYPTSNELKQKKDLQPRDLLEKIHVLESTLKDYSNFLDFSQLGEQQVLLNIIRRISKKFKFPKIYLDIGAFHPTIGSNTFMLYRMDWKGVVIEANPKKLNEWHIIRPNDYAICAAIVPENWNLSSVPMTCIGDKDKRESVSYHLNKNSRQIPSNEHNVYNAAALKISDLMNLVLTKNLIPFFLNMDIEGLEQEVTISSKLASYKIPLICIKQFLNEFTDSQSVLAYSKSDLVTYLEKSDYYLVSVCGFSLIFCHKDYWIPYH